jgi:hypothetical protein
MNVAEIPSSEYEKDVRYCLAGMQNPDPQARGRILDILIEDVEADQRFLDNTKALMDDTAPCLLYVRQFTYAEVRWNATLAFANQHFLLNEKEPIFISNVVIPIERHELAILAEEFEIKEKKTILKKEIQME